MTPDCSLYHPMVDHTDHTRLQKKAAQYDVHETFGAGRSA